MTIELPDSIVEARPPSDPNGVLTGPIGRGRNHEFTHIEEQRMLSAANKREEKTRKTIADEYPGREEKIAKNTNDEVARIRSGNLTEHGASVEGLQAVRASLERVIAETAVQHNAKFALAMNYNGQDPTVFNPIRTQPGFRWRDALDYKFNELNWERSYEAFYDARLYKHALSLLDKHLANVNAEIKRLAEQTVLQPFDHSTYRLTANGVPAVTLPGLGTIPVAQTATVLRQGIADAVSALGRLALAGPGASIATFLTLVTYSTPTASEKQDRIPERFRFALGVNADQLGLAAGTNLQQIAASQGSVELPWRLINRILNDGHVGVSVAKADGMNVSKSVPVRSAAFDPKSGLYTAVLPSRAHDRPAITLTWTPSTPPGNHSSSSSTPAVPPPVPVYNGVELKPQVIKPEVYPGILPDVSDLIITFPADAGLPAVYVMFSNPYGETNAKGRYSGRAFNTEKAGGPILDLDWRSAVIDQAGVSAVKLHTARFGESPDNTVMIDRLERILKGTLKISDTDKRFYTHELRELERYRALGVKDGERPDNLAEVWNNTHTATLEDYKINERTQPLYTAEAEEAYFKGAGGQ